MAQAATVRLNSVVAIEDFDEGSLALDCEHLRLVELNRTARAIVAGVERGLGLSEIAAQLAEEYGQPEDAMHADVTVAVERMVALGILLPLPGGQE